MDAKNTGAKNTGAKNTYVCAGELDDPLELRPQARRRMHRCGMMEHLSPQQVENFQKLVRVYIPDMAKDAAAVEALLVLVEVCHLLNVMPSVMEEIFGARVITALHLGGDLIPAQAGSAQAGPAQAGSAPAGPVELQRVWVWAPAHWAPKLLPVEAGGVIHLEGPTA